MAVAGDAGRRRGMKKNAAGRLRHVTLFYSFFGPVVALMSSYAQRGRDRSATRPDITSRATQLRAKGARVAIYEATALERTEVREPFIPRQDPLEEERCKTYVMKHLRFCIM